MVGKRSKIIKEKADQMDINQLDLEVPKVITDEYATILSNAFDNIKRINCLILNGEQPLFDECSIAVIIRQIMANDIKIGYFVTFSTPEIVISNRSIMHLQMLYDHCDNKDRCSCIIKIEEQDPNYFEFDMKIREKFEFVSNRMMEYEQLFDRNSVFCTNGIDICINDIVNPISISEDGQVFAGRNIPKNCDHLSIGNLHDNILRHIADEHIKDHFELQEIEIPIEGDISFSQYWESLSEDKRGDWFGYVFSKMFDRNFPGYGLYQVVKDNPGLSKFKGFEEIVTILGLESNVPPPWIVGNEIKWEENVKSEFLGYAQILRDMVYNRSPMLEMIDIYYQDLPYKAQIRLKNLIERFIESAKTENQNA